MASPTDTIGLPVGRAEGPEKVTGRALYPGDVKLDGLLVGKCLRSPYPHARIASIDASAARSLPGVHAVLTGFDIPFALVGRDTCDIPVLARDRVLFAGQKLAAVAAESRELAEEALSRIEVEYEPLGALLDPLEALAPDALVLHPDYESYANVPDRPRSHRNLVAEVTWKKGDVESAWAACDRVFEHRFRTQHQHQGYIEPHACVAWIDASGRAQFWANSKMPFQLRTSIARGIGLPPEQVCIHPAFIGGDFGGKGGFMDTHVAYWLAKSSGRPVRMTMSYAEELQAGNPRHPAVMIFRTGVRRDGTIVARHAELYFDSGASAGFRPTRGVGYGPRCLGPYRMEHARIDSRMVYTNHVPCGSMRSPGDPQTVFAGEAQIDLVARELGIDPLELRLKNVVREGDESPLGQRWKNPMAARLLAECGRVARARTLLPSRPGLRTGRGFAICERPVGGGRAIARVRVAGDGSVTLAIALRDTGSGFYTMLRQVVGRELGVRYDAIRLETLSTDDVAADQGVGGARVTNSAGNAARGAALAVREQLCGLALEQLGWPADDIRFESGALLAEGRAPVPLADLLARAGRSHVEAEHAHDGKSGDSTVFAVQAVEVEVDEETGQVAIARVVSVHDVGQILNPIAHQGQIEGGLMQGIGQALMEELIWDDGRVANASLAEYKMPTIADIPELETVLVPSEAAGPAPYGGKAIGEHSISTVAPAVHNAVLDAVGVSIRELPITAEKVHRALRER